MKVVALKNHSIDGTHRYNVGDVYEISEKSARLLAQLGWVTLEAEPVEPTDETKKRYKRKDLRAES